MKKIKIKNKKFRQLMPDIKYNSITVTLFINFIMQDGKKQTSKKIVYKVMENLRKHWKIEKNDNEQLINRLKIIVRSCDPVYRITSVKRGGGVYQVPFLLKKFTGFKKSIKNLIKNAKKRKEYDMFNKLTKEIIDSEGKISSTYKQKQNILSLAKKNAAFSDLF